MNTIICTSVGNDGFPSILNALREDRSLFIIGCDSDGCAPGLVLADRGVVVPPRTQEQLLLESIVDCKRENGTILLPLSTEDQDFYSKHKLYFNMCGINVIVASAAAISIANDKHRLYGHCSRYGYPIPKYFVTRDSDSAVEAIMRYSEQGERCVIKLARGTGSQGVKIVDPNYDECADFWGRNKLVVSLGDVLKWLKACNLREPLLISAYLAGTHMSVDAIMTGDGGFHAVCRTETQHLYGLATRGETVDNPEIIALSRSIMISLGLTGACNLEFRYGADCVPYLLEINPRFGGSIGHTVAAGANLPLALVYSELGQAYKVLPAKVGFRFARFWGITSCKPL